MKGLAAAGGAKGSAARFRAGACASWAARLAWWQELPLGLLPASVALDPPVQHRLSRHVGRQGDGDVRVGVGAVGLAHRGQQLCLSTQGVELHGAAHAVCLCLWGAAEAALPKKPRRRQQQHWVPGTVFVDTPLPLPTETRCIDQIRLD